MSAASFTDPSPAGAAIKSAHVTELRSAINAAFNALGVTNSGYANPASSDAPVRAIDFQELRDRVR